MQKQIPRTAITINTAQTSDVSNAKKMRPGSEFQEFMHVHDANVHDEIQPN